MIEFILVWVMTVQTDMYSNSNTSYQLTYATQQTCLKQARKHMKHRSGTRATCDFQQVPVYKQVK